jgi:hypothetical protein
VCERERQRKREKEIYILKKEIKREWERNSDIQTKIKTGLN